MFHAPFNVGLYKSLINGAVIFSVIPFCANYKASSPNQTVVTSLMLTFKPLLESLYFFPLSQ